jgi:hypothetical protein
MKETKYFLLKKKLNYSHLFWIGLYLLIVFLIIYSLLGFEGRPNEHIVARMILVLLFFFLILLGWYCFEEGKIKLTKIEKERVFKEK